MSAAPRPNKGGFVGRLQIAGVVKVVRPSQLSTSKKRICSEFPLSSNRCTEISGPAPQGVPKSRTLRTGAPVITSSMSTPDREVRARISAPACTVHGEQLQQSQVQTLSAMGSLQLGAMTDCTSPAVVPE